MRERDRKGDRRAALAHWVSEHFRQSRKSDEMHKVREHLRGSVSCDWYGLEVCIEPSADDYVRLEADLRNRWYSRVHEWQRQFKPVNVKKKKKKKKRKGRKKRRQR